MGKDYRRYERFVVPEDKLLACEGLGRALDGLVSVLGLGGMFVRTRESFPVGTVLGVRIRSNGEVVETECVVRDVEPGGLGVEFVKLRGQHEETLKKIVARFKS